MSAEDANVQFSTHFRIYPQKIIKVSRSRSQVCICYLKCQCTCLARGKNRWSVIRGCSSVCTESARGQETADSANGQIFDLGLRGLQNVHNIKYSLFLSIEAMSFKRARMSRGSVWISSLCHNASISGFSLKMT